MKHLTLKTKIFLLFLLVGIGVFAQDYSHEPDRFFENPELQDVNRLPMHSSFFVYNNLADLKADKKQKAENYLDLNGIWKFAYFEDYKKAYKDFYKVKFPDNDWANFSVPANWEFSGYGTPIYVNPYYPFAMKNPQPPKIPSDINQPVGLYRKSFDLPQDWDGKKVYLHLGAVKSAFKLYVNGEFAGFGNDSKLESEYDLTPYLQKGKNLIALEVRRWSAGSYLEAQDFWRISGIERDVYLYARPEVNFDDVKIVSDLVNNYKDGKLQITTSLTNNSNESKENYTISVELKTPKGVVIYQSTQKTKGLARVKGKTVVRFNQKIPNVKAWTAETPYLYQLAISLKNEKGDIVEAIPFKVGFRNVKISEGNLLVNGKRIWIKGVNRHETEPDTHHVVTREQIIRDMRVMKELNINAIRTSHYPQTPMFYDLADEYGFYIVDEANIESHGMHYAPERTIANDPAWENAHITRVSRMIERDKNHPSVIIWSMGNEAGNGWNFYKAYDIAKALDQTRPVQYERAEHEYNTDLFVPMYITIEDMKKYSNSNYDKPLILTEYTHAMGNSLGVFKDYWETIRSYPKLQGGFIWDFADQGIYVEKDGIRYTAYGGDLGDENTPSDNNFLMNGVVMSDRRYNPHAYEVRHIHQNARFKFNAKKHQIEVFNDYFFKPLENFNYEITWLENGKLKAQKNVKNLNVGAQQTAYINLPEDWKFSNEKETVVTIKAILDEDEQLLKKGTLLAHQDFEITKYQPKLISHYLSYKKSETSDYYQISAGDLSFKIAKNNGRIENLKIGKQELLLKGPQISLFRPLTDNDLGAGFGKRFDQYKNLNIQVAGIDFTQNSIVITQNLLDGNSQNTMIYKFPKQGGIEVKNHFKPINTEEKYLLRLGNDIEISKKLTQLKWFGDGPWESYIDRKNSSMLGVYESTVEEQYHPYARPQESGNHTDVRYMEVKDKQGRGIKISATTQVLDMSVLPYSWEQLYPKNVKEQEHSEFLKPDKINHLRVDLFQMGLGGINSWGRWPHENARTKMSEYEYSYIIQPLK